MGRSEQQRLHVCFFMRVRSLLSPNHPRHVAPTRRQRRDPRVAKPAAQPAARRCRTSTEHVQWACRTHPMKKDLHEPPACCVFRVDVGRRLPLKPPVRHEPVVHHEVVHVQLHGGRAERAPAQAVPRVRDRLVAADADRPDRGAAVAGQRVRRGHLALEVVRVRVQLVRAPVPVTGWRSTERQ